MAKEMKDIQQLINDKADAKLKTDLKALQKSIYSGIYYDLIKDMKVNVGTHEKPKEISLYAIFSNYGFEEEIIQKNTERYRQRESEEFMSKVETLREDVDNLFNNYN